MNNANALAFLYNNNGGNMKKFDLEWNEFVEGFVLTIDDTRSINVQYEPNRNTNHPQPDIVAVIGAAGDETILQFTEKEQEEIKKYISANAEIQKIAIEQTEALYDV